MQDNLFNAPQAKLQEKLAGDVGKFLASQPHCWVDRETVVRAFTLSGRAAKQPGGAAPLHYFKRWCERNGFTIADTRGDGVMYKLISEEKRAAYG